MAVCTAQVVGVALALCALAAPSSAWAADPLGGKVRVSGFANLTGAGLPAERDESGGGLFSEIGVQVTPQWKTDRRIVVAARATFGGTGQLDGFGDAWAGSVGELSFFVIGPFGRIEIGERAGFPQTLLGYAPAEVAFANSEYSPESGTRLSPNGRLATAFLSPALAGRINSITYLGYAARYYDSASPKIIYVSPRKRGFYAALSYAPRSVKSTGLALSAAGDRGERTAPLSPPGSASEFRDLVQAAFVWQRRSENLDLTLGTTFSHAREEIPGASLGRRTVSSISSGATAIVRDTWELGLSATYDGFSEAVAGAVGGADPFGVVASLNWIGGSFFVGGYYQYASAPAPVGAFERDRVHVAQLGGAYLIPSAHDWLGEDFYTDLKIYADVTYTRFADGTRPGWQRGDVVLLVGARFSFY